MVGLSHRTASISVRELIAIPKDIAPRVLAELVARPSVREAMLVSTCNRVEVVAAGERADAELGEVARDVTRALVERAPGLGEHLYVHEGAAGVRHLFRVASSLDSLVLGEPQILGQVKDAFEAARAAGTLGPRLHRVVSRAIRAAKRVRSTTMIGSGLVSVPSVAVDLARQIFGDLRGRSVVLIGSGEMAETAARLLAGAGARLSVVGRNELRVAELARLVAGEPRPWSDLRAALVEADVVITSTSAPAYVVELELVSSLRKQRRGRSLFFIDLAVPRDVDPAVDGLDNVFLYNVDDLSRVVADSVSSRAREAERAEAIVAEETAGYERWEEAAQVTPTVVALRSRLRRVLYAELDHSLRTKLKHLGAGERDALRRMLDAALNKMLHGPTARLRELAVEHGEEGPSVDQMTSMLGELFALDDPSLEAEPRSVPSDGEPESDETHDETHDEAPRAASGRGAS
ncbi:MAG: glutamyl-tRNA reductase [Sorangiineae bacterium]|nr:glutamyl-tRNA reductase [Polyangiaceae bacterium]MEB2321680.1 glutamyl-tRNA reductase [Sorangiineae bacterium]